MFNKNEEWSCSLLPPPKSSFQLSSSKKSKKGNAGERPACCYHSVTLCSSAAPNKLSPLHVPFTAFLSCAVEAKYAEPSLWAIYKVTTIWRHATLSMWDTQPMPEAPKRWGFTSVWSSAYIANVCMWVLFTISAYSTCPRTLPTIMGWEGWKRWAPQDFDPMGH